MITQTFQDLAIELDFDDFKWHWDTYSLGPKTGAVIISKHLILPLISTVHVAFSSPDAVGEIPEGDLGAVSSYSVLISSQLYHALIKSLRLILPAYRESWPNSSSNR